MSVNVENFKFIVRSENIFLTLHCTSIFSEFLDKLIDSYFLCIICTPFKYIQIALIFVTSFTKSIREQCVRKISGADKEKFSQSSVELKKVISKNDFLKKKVRKMHKLRELLIRNI